MKSTFYKCYSATYEWLYLLDASHNSLEIKMSDGEFTLLTKVITNLHQGTLSNWDEIYYTTSLNAACTYDPHKCSTSICSSTLQAPWNIFRACILDLITHLIAMPDFQSILRRFILPIYVRHPQFVVQDSNFFPVLKSRLLISWRPNLVAVSLDQWQLRFLFLSQTAKMNKFTASSIENHLFNYHSSFL